MSPVEQLLRGRIEREGPLPFSSFMETALYHPQHGYYTNSRDPFGKSGDFYTASQLQPVFGRLLAQVVSRLRDSMGDAEFQVTEWGAGRGDLHEFLKPYGYRAVESLDELPPPSRGVAFANELFDALPVDVARFTRGRWIEMRVGVDDARLAFVDGPGLSDEWLDYARRYLAVCDSADEVWLELPVRAERVLAAMTSSLTAGEIILIDYGFTAREAVRFPKGTLMSYRKHTAIDDVLANPGEQDITAHVPFDFVRACAPRCGLREKSFETLAQWLLRAGEADSFAHALRASTPDEETRLRLQLKSLVFGMGETFRVLTFAKE